MSYITLMSLHCTYFVSYLNLFENIQNNQCHIPATIACLSHVLLYLFFISSLQSERHIFAKPAIADFDTRCPCRNTRYESMGQQDKIAINATSGFRIRQSWQDMKPGRVEKRSTNVSFVPVYFLTNITWRDTWPVYTKCSRSIHYDKTFII